jgi:NAD(P)-dependent dehydrogenase (short-subunit alcohol dehydrogenase family)
VTGATGFIGKRLVRKLLARPGAEVAFLVRDPAPERMAKLADYWGVDVKSLKPLKGDLTRPDCGVSAAAVKSLGKIDHMFHLAAIYDLAADPKEEMETNIEGTRNAVSLAAKVKAGCFHHVSSIAAAGLYNGVFREDMFDEAEHLDHPYFASKHESEKVVRKECKTPWRVYRPGVVVGDSKTGEMDKIDGPYYFFKFIQKLRKMLPAWMPTIGLEGGRINIVPVDFVVAALDHIAHVKGQDGKAFHLTDSDPHRVGDVLNIFAKAAHAPAMTVRVNAGLFGFVPPGVARALMALTPVRRVQRAIMSELGLPDGIFSFINYPTRFDNRDAEKLLKPAGITVPPLESYAHRLWDYWERNLDPDLFIDRSLKGQVGGRVVVITGGSAGIGKAAAMRVAEAGAKTIIVGRDQAKLDEARKEAQAKGFDLITYSADLADMSKCAELAVRITKDHGGVDVLVNNAGRSIRRGIENSYDRMHDFERTMAINYFGALHLTMGLLPGMSARKRGHIINISSIGVLTNAPRFSAYVASKAALDAWTRCAASEFLDRHINFTTINMPLVATDMTAPTSLYKNVPMLSTDEAADFIVDAIIHKQSRIATRLGVLGQVLNALTPRFGQIIMNTTFRMFPDSAAAKGKKEGKPEMPNADQIAFTQLLRGLHF